MSKNLDLSKKTSALILAAGNSTRMGSPKFMLRFDNKHTFLEKIIEGYKEFGCNEIIVVVNPSGAKILQQFRSQIIDNKYIVVNTQPESERFISIQTGLNAFNNPENVFIHPLDNPFVDSSVLESLFQNSKNSDYQVPQYMGKGGHPVLISKNVIESIVNSGESDVSLKAFLTKFIQNRVIVNRSEILVNINSLEEYKALFKYDSRNI